MQARPLSGLWSRLRVAQFLLAAVCGWLETFPLPAWAAPGDPGTLDTGFGSSNTVDSALQTMALQSDGRLLIGGSFSSVTGKLRPFLARLNEDGTLDPSFQPGQAAPVTDVVPLADGRILVAGSFLSFNGHPRNSLARLHANGQLDSTFKPVWSQVPVSIRRILVRGDGRFYILGDFTQYAGHPTVGVALLHPNGIVDTSFTSAITAGLANSLALGPDALNGPELLVGGVSFTFSPQENRRFIAKLDALSGVFLPAFNVPALPQGIIGAAYQILPLADGRLLAAGLHGGSGLTNALNGMIRLQPIGALYRFFLWGPVPALFEPAAAAQPFQTFVRLTNGRVVAGGRFNFVQGWPRTNLVQLLTDGAVDPSFDPGVGPNNTVNNLLLQPDGKVLVSGFFSAVAGEARPFLARLHGLGSTPLVLDAPQPQTVWEGDPVTLRIRVAGDPDPSITWYRGATAVGTGATFSLAAVQTSDAGEYRVRLVNAHGTAESVPVTLTVLSGPPHVVGGPVDAAVALKATAQFRVEVTGSRPFQYQWFENGLLMPGQTNALLQVPVVSETVYGNTYRAIVTNPRGAAPTGEATLGPSLEGALDVEFSYLAQFAKTMVPGFSEFHLNLREARQLARQPDGHILVGGGLMTLPTRSLSHLLLPDFQPEISFAALGITQSSNHLIRLDAGGELALGDLRTRFLDGPVNDLAVASDGAFYAVGAFSKFGDASRPGIIRFHADGTFDSTFAVTYLPTNAALVAVAVQSDGRVLVGGTFTNIGGLPRRTVARILVNGQPDPTFTPAVRTGSAGALFDVAVQANDKVLLAGAGTFVDTNFGFEARQLARLNNDGSWDEDFDTAGGATAGTTDFYVRRIVVQPDQRLLVLGQFESFGGVANTNVARLLPDGSSDPDFRAPGNSVRDIAVAADGRLYFASSTPVPWNPTTRMGRLFSNGEPDPSWVPASGRSSFLRLFGSVEAVLVQPNGQPVFAGDFQPAFLPDLDVPMSLSFPPWVNGRYYAVLREDQYTVYMPYGDARHAVDGLIRCFDSSVVPGNLVILTQPKGVVVSAASSNYVLSVSATVPGTPAKLSYQWMKNGFVLPGETNGFILLAPLTTAQSGPYSVLVTAETGFGPGQNVLSQTAHVKVLPAGQLLRDVHQLGFVGDAFQWKIPAGNGVVLTASDLAGMEVWTSSNLVDWVTLPNALQLQDGNLLIHDPEPPGRTMRFYRLEAVAP